MSQHNQSTGLYTFKRTEMVITGYDDERQDWISSLMAIEVTIDLDRLYNDVQYTVSKSGKATRVRGAIVAKRIKPPKRATA